MAGGARAATARLNAGTTVPATSIPARKKSLLTYLQVAPLTVVLLFFVPCRWRWWWSSASSATRCWSGIVPDFTFQNYADMLTNPTTWTLYLSTIKFTLIVLAITFVLGFWIAYFLVFHVRNLITAIGCSWSARCRSGHPTSSA
jgi:putative spermidine/putrescine transport system permease protein